MRQSNASGGRSQGGSRSLQRLDGPRARVLLLGLDALTWLYVLILFNRALG
jgi:hypothetical protein